MRPATAFGLGVARYKGLQEFRHSGSTGSYRTFLSRFPEPHVSLAVLCNAGDSTPRQTLHAVADLYLGRCAASGSAAEGGDVVRRRSSMRSPACIAISTVATCSGSNATATACASKTVRLS